MNNSWKNSSNSSGGFVYFNTSNSFSNSNEASHNISDTADFVSFESDASSNGSPHTNHFSPSNFSSPRNHYNGRSPRTRGGGKNSYYSPIKSMGKSKFWRKNAGLTGYSNHDTQSQGPSPHNQMQKNRNSHNSISNQNHGKSSFFDPTCVMDPWTELEKKHLEEKNLCNSSLKQGEDAPDMKPKTDSELVSDSGSTESSSNSDDTEDEADNSMS